MKGVLSCLLALMLALSITPSVFAEETVGSTTNNVDAINGDDTQEGVGTTTDKAYKTEETVGGTTNNVNAIKGNDTQEGVGTNTDKAYKTKEPVGGKTIYVDATNGNDEQEDVGTTSGKAYKTLAVAVAAAQSGDTIQLSEGNYTLYGVSSEGHTKGKELTFVGQGTDKTGWKIGPEVPNPAYFGTEYNSDYSLKGAGTITFKNMTLRSGSENYLGFSYAKQYDC